MTSGNAKSKLYLFVDEMKQHAGLEPFSYPLDLLKWCRSQPRIDLQTARFHKEGFCGMALLGETVDTILLNASRHELERNFDCAHELIHLQKHRNCGMRHFDCFEKILPSQDPFLEWQANEGAAELLLPRQELMRILSERGALLQKRREITRLKTDLAEQFHLSDRVVHFRLESLKYEIQQVLAGVPEGKIVYLSTRQQQQRGIAAPSLNDLEIALAADEPAVPLQKHTRCDHGRYRFSEIEDAYLYHIP